MENLKETMRDVLENNILSYWLTKVKDEENGVFSGYCGLKKDAAMCDGRLMV